MQYVQTLLYRIAGNLYTNQYFLPQTTLEDAITAGVAVFQAQRNLQTPDTEYVSNTITELEYPFASHPVAIAHADIAGSVTGDNAMPAITFLEFTFYPVSSKGRTTHRIRGCANNYLTDLGVFSATSTGLGDVDGTGVGETPTVYRNYLDVVAVNTRDKSNNVLAPSDRIAVGSKRATRRL